jgi:beta-glucosidase
MGEPHGLSFWENCWWLDPVYRGEFSEKAARLVHGVFPELSQTDLGVIKQDLDFFGMNNYRATAVRDRAEDSPQRLDRTLEEGYPVTAMGWPVTPENLYWGPKYFYERYGLPILVTENGMANLDWVALDGEVHDPQRIDFLARSLGYLKKAAKEGIDIKGYCQWSFSDNFEWAYGYNRRFGLVFVDYKNGNRRIVKDSGRWYRDVISSNGEIIEIPG